MRLSALLGLHVVRSATAYPLGTYPLQAMQPCSCPHYSNTLRGWRLLALIIAVCQGKLFGKYTFQSCHRCRMRNTGLYDILFISGKQGEGWYFQLHCWRKEVGHRKVKCFLRVRQQEAALKCCFKAQGIHFPGMLCFPSEPKPACQRQWAKLHWACLPTELI